MLRACCLAGKISCASRGQRAAGLASPASRAHTATSRRGILLGTAAAFSRTKRSRAEEAMAPIPTEYLPKLVAFDLDSTLWYPEMYMLSGAPFKKDAKGAVFDRRGEQVELLGASAAILKELATDPKWKDTQVAYVSRTEYPEWAIPCMKLFDIAPGKTMFSLSSYNEIHECSKKYHFKNIHRASGIDYEDMIFFDNERYNCTDCQTLGITCIYTPDGMTSSNWAEGLAKHAQKVAKRS
ncbi:acid phosphatase-domain-containing protein [Dunaliella salina]|uniref:Acid phosphatase-domain-containing protein n=1 Tax=Dunaliella salina TaxID=3046 RepID=A0ABQ7GFH9_DUNSA|nr:acid phosphatase-domain-containing protein [Dunaliella salina]|eukprot:KAF5833361.1 acid phosphatase-domain-containing protein [Dunaliella salina]